MKSGGTHSIRQMSYRNVLNSYWIRLNWKLFGNKTTNIYLAFVNILIENRQIRIIIHFIWGFSHCLAVSQIHDIFHRILLRQNVSLSHLIFQHSLFYLEFQAWAIASYMIFNGDFLSLRANSIYIISKL